MEVVVAFAHRQESGEQVITRRQFVVIRCTSEPVRNRVDAKRTLGIEESKSAGRKKEKKGFMVDRHDERWSYEVHSQNKNLPSSLPTRDQGW